MRHFVSELKIFPKIARNFESFLIGEVKFERRTLRRILFSSDNCERIDFVESNDNSLSRRKRIISKVSLVNKIKPNCNSYNTSKEEGLLVL